MAEDIVTLLRAIEYSAIHYQTPPNRDEFTLAGRAAKEIEMLRATIAELQTALHDTRVELHRVERENARG